MLPLWILIGPRIRLFVTSYLLVLRMFWFTEGCGVCFFKVFNLHYHNECPWLYKSLSQFGGTKQKVDIICALPHTCTQATLNFSHSALLRSPDLILAVKAARMCFRSPLPCKIKSSWLDSTLPRQSRKLLMFESRFLKGAKKLQSSVFESLYENAFSWQYDFKMRSKVISTQWKLFL